MALMTSTSAPFFALTSVVPRPGSARRHVERAHETRLATDENERLLLVEGVIAERHRVGSGIDQLGADRLRDAEAAGRILAVDGNEIQPVALDEAGQVLQHHRPARPADDIAEEEEAHGGRLSQLFRPRSLSGPGPGVQPGARVRRNIDEVWEIPQTRSAVC